MEIPPRYSSIVEEVTERAIKYASRGRVPPPTLIKGGPYSGAHLIVHEIYRRLCGEKSLTIKFLRLRLSDTQLSNDINRDLALVGRSAKKPTIFFIDGVDRLLNLPARNIKGGTKKGRGAKVSEIVEEAHRLRKVLTENSTKVTLISSSGLSTKFMEDPDLPFYKFFNETSVTQLTAEESVKFFFTLIKRNGSIDIKLPFFAELGEASYEWPYRITGGHWLLLLKLQQVLCASPKATASSSKPGSSSPPAIDEFFLQLQPIFLQELAGFAREERRFIESAALLATNFILRDVAFDQGNASSIAKSLVEKGILTKSEKSVGRFSFSHTALRTLLRYFTGANLIDVFSDTRSLL